jgi:peptidyl-prolyl cis-trans isomerase SurA
MRKLLTTVLLLCTAVSWVPARAGDVLDRIIAIVNKNPILLSDWDEALRCEALLGGRTPQSYTAEEQQAAFQRLVDQELLREQMRSYLLPPIADADVQARLNEVRKELAPGDETKWRTLLQQAGVSEAEVFDRLRTQAEIDRFLDVRFRSGIRIDDRSVTRYYRDDFLPELRKAGGGDVPLESVAGKIREILMQQHIAEQLTAWLQTLREQTDIRILNSKSTDVSTGPESNTEPKAK